MHSSAMAMKLSVVWQSSADERNEPDTLGCLDDFDKVLRKEAIDEVIFALPGDRMLDLRSYLEYVP